MKASSRWVPIGTIAAAVFGWAVYTMLVPSLPPTEDRAATTQPVEPPESSQADATPENELALPQAPKSLEAGGGEDRNPRRRSPTVESPAASTNFEAANSPEESAPIAAWRTADGKLYFGNEPPPGSVRIEKFGKPVAPKNTPRSAASGDSRVTSSVWSQPQNCRLETTIEYRTVQDDRAGGGLTLSGVLTHEGSTLIKDVSVCSGGTCAPILEGQPMREGDRASFSLKLAAGAGATPVVLCSILKP